MLSDQYEKQLKDLKKVLTEEEYRIIIETTNIVESIKEIKTKEKELKDNIVPIGHRVEIVRPENPLEEKRFNELIGQEGVCIGHESSPDYFYRIWFLNEKARNLHLKGGGVFFNPMYVSDKGKDTNLYHQYEEWNEEKEREKLYRWGTCEKCNGPMDMHYTLWCPSCDKPEFNKEKDNSLDFIKMLTYLEVRNKGIKERFWDYFWEETEFSNDSYKVLRLKNEHANPQIQQDLSLIKDTWTPKEESILVWISW